MSGRPDRRLRVDALLRALPVVFLLHDAEEVLTVEGFWRRNRDAIPLPEALKDRLQTTARQMAVAVAVVSCFVFLASYLARSAPRRPGGRLAFFDAVVAALLLDSLKHAAQTLALRRYTPGVVTAVAACLPYSACTLYRLRAEGLVARGELRRSLVTGGALVVPVVLGAHAVARGLARR